MANADCIIIQGSNMAECHPVGFQWVTEAKARGARIIHVDPRFTRTTAIADKHVPIRAGSDIVLLGALTAAAVVQIGFGFAPVAWLAIVLLCVVGYLEATQEVLRYSLIQHHTPGPLLGRVNGIWMAQEVGGVTIGALVAGAFGTIWTASDAIVYYGLALLVLSIIAACVLRAVVKVRSERPVESSIS